MSGSGYLTFEEVAEKPSLKGAASGDGERELKPTTDRALGYVVAKYAHLARVDDVSPHDMRHRFGYEMAKRVPLHRLAQIMGHDSLDTTMVYVKRTRRPSTSSRREGVGVMGAILVDSCTKNFANDTAGCKPLLAQDTHRFCAMRLKLPRCFGWQAMVP